MWTIEECLNPENTPAARHTEFNKRVQECTALPTFTERLEALDALGTQTAEVLKNLEIEHFCTLPDLFLDNAQLCLLDLIGSALPKGFIAGEKMWAIAQHPHCRDAFDALTTDFSEVDTFKIWSKHLANV